MMSKKAFDERKLLGPKKPAVAKRAPKAAKVKKPTAREIDLVVLCDTYNLLEIYWKGDPMLYPNNIRVPAGSGTPEIIEALLDKLDGHLDITYGILRPPVLGSDNDEDDEGTLRDMILSDLEDGEPLSEIRKSIARILGTKLDREIDTLRSKIIKAEEARKQIFGD